MSDNLIRTFQRLTNVFLAITAVALVVLLMWTPVESGRLRLKHVVLCGYAILPCLVIFAATSARYKKDYPVVVPLCAWITSVLMLGLTLSAYPGELTPSPSGPAGAVAGAAVGFVPILLLLGAPILYWGLVTIGRLITPSMVCVSAGSTGGSANRVPGKRPWMTLAIVGFVCVLYPLVKVAMHARDYSPVHAAADDNDPEMLRSLIQSGVDVDTRDKYGLTPLHHAAEANSIATAEELIAAGADVNATCKRWPTTPLHRAARAGSVDAARMLISAGAKLSLNGPHGHTPLHLTVRNPDQSLTELLIVSGADLEAKDQDGHTPLHLAAAYGCLEATQLLIDHGANVDAENKLGRTPLRMARIAVSGGYPKRAARKSPHFSANTMPNSLNCCLPPKRKKPYNFQRFDPPSPRLQQAGVSTF